MTTLRPHPTMRPQREAARAANALRSEHLEALVDGVLTPNDVVRIAADPDHRALGSMRLALVLSAAPGMTDASALARLRRLAATLELEEDLSGKTINWLLDRRAGGRRLLAWLDGDHPRSLPWPGFPWAPAPDSHRDQRRRP